MAGCIKKNSNFAVFQKKTECGPAVIKSKNINLKKTNHPYLIEKGSIMYQDEKLIESNDEYVKDQLYVN